jgi:hypothetical protein
MESINEIVLHPALFMVASFALATIGLKIYSLTKTAKE